MDTVRMAVLLVCGYVFVACLAMIVAYERIRADGPAFLLAVLWPLWLPWWCLIRGTRLVAWLLVDGAKDGARILANELPRLLK